MLLRRAVNPGGCSFGFVLFVAVLLGFAPAPAQAQGRREREASDVFRVNGPKVFAAFRDVVAQPSQATVRVLCDGKETALGTIVAADGWIVSKSSEIKGSITCLLKDGRELPARITGVHEPYDLVMLKVHAKDLHPVQWADVATAVVGNFVATPSLGSDPAAVGVVSVKARTVTARDLPISGTSGYLGVQLEPSEMGVKIAQITPNSAAAKAGFKVNDAVVAVAGILVKDPDTLIAAIQRYKVGEVVTMKVKRGEAEVEIKATLGRRPQGDRADFQNRLGNDMSIRRGGFPSILQHDTPLRPKDCGGPLVDLDGKAVGINIARAGRTETYAVPADAVLSLLPDLKSGKLMSAELREALAAQEAAQAKLKATKAAVDKAEAALKTAHKKPEAERKAAVDKAEAEMKTAEKRFEEAKAALASLNK